MRPSPTLRRWSRFRRWLLGIAALALLSIGVVGIVTATLAWSPEELGPRRAATAMPALEPGEVRIVTLNAWKLSDAARVPKLLTALDETGRMLADGAMARPEIFAIQEIESSAAAAALGAAVSATHWWRTCTCDPVEGHEGGPIASAVGLGVSRDAFVVRDHRCIALGAQWPDHARCAIAVRLAPTAGAEDDTVADGAERDAWTIIGVHMAWHYDNAPMTRRLIASLPPEGSLVVVGDFNTWPGRPAYEAWLDAGLVDAHPGGPPTTVVDRRVDLVLHRGPFEVRRVLDRRETFERLRPSASISLPGLPFGLRDGACVDDPDDCPVSDHLPEGVVLAPNGHRGP